MGGDTVYSEGATLGSRQGSQRRGSNSPSAGSHNTFFDPRQGSVSLASRSSAGSWQKGPFWISNDSAAGPKPGPRQRIQIIMHPEHHHSRSNWIRGGPILSTQREQLWAVDKAARGEGATLQALAATPRPTQREHLWAVGTTAVGTTAGAEGATLLHHWHFNNQP